MTSSIHGASPHRESKVGLLVFWLFLHGLALTILLAALVVVVPRFDKMFQEFGLKLPLASVLVINLSRRLWRYGLLIVPSGIILDCGMLCLLFLVDRMPRGFRTLWCCGVLVVAVCLIVLVAIAVFLPLIGLIQGLA